jgi:flagella basal body P-ring formation protein FlgA
MNIILRNLIASVMVGFMAPTLAFATMETLPGDGQGYLFQLSAADVEGAVGFALADKGAGGKIGATLNGVKNHEPLFSYSKPVSVEIRGLQFDKASTRWNASMVVLSEGRVVSALPLSGRYEELLEVPVLKRQVRAGDTIKDSDVELRDVALSRTRSDTISDMASLIGKSPVRAISPGRPIREQEIAKPTLVQKNSIVQMRYNSPGVNITTTGQAVDEGGKGSVISVRNINSKKLVRAVVVDENTVAIVNAEDRYAALTR